jgi:hypothetical protein
MKMSASLPVKAGHGQALTQQSPYGAEYFDWQSGIGRFGGWANLSKFSSYIRGDMKVLDFGSGGGYLLANIRCGSKIGIEINSVACAEAARNGVTTVRSADEVEDGWANLIISNHTLEHCQNPLAELKGLLRKPAPDGIAVFVFPCEAAKTRTERAIGTITFIRGVPCPRPTSFRKPGFMSSNPRYTFTSGPQDSLRGCYVRSVAGPSLRLAAEPTEF